MTPDELRAVALEALSDQAWAAFARHLPDVKRIADGGPDGSERDARIVRMVCDLVAGELHRRLTD